MSNVFVEIRGRPAKMNRIVRYSRTGYTARTDADKCAMPCPATLVGRKLQASKFHHDMPTREELIGTLLPPDRISFQLQVPQSLEDVEAMLHETSYYYRSCFTPGDRFDKPDLLRWQPFFGQSILSDMIDQYVIAVGAAERSKYTTARIFLDRAHRQLHLAILAQHSQLLGTIFGIVHTRSHNASFETADIFGRFAADMAAAIHGQSHPITKSVQMFCRTTASQGVFFNAHDQMRLATARNILGDMHGETIVLKIASCYGLRGSHNDVARCENLLDEALATAELKYGPLNDLTLRALLDRAGFYLRGSNYLDWAESGFKEVVRRCPESSVDKATAHARLKAMKGLLTVASVERCWSKSESICREALSVSVEELGHDHYYTRGLVESLVDSLLNQGRDQEAREWAKLFRLEIEANL